MCVCHNEENMHDEWQARHATQAMLVSIAQPKKKLIVKEEAGDHRPRTVLNTSESQSFNYMQGKTDTKTNYEICLGVHFASVSIYLRTRQYGHRDKLRNLSRCPFCLVH